MFDGLDLKAVTQSMSKSSANIPGGGRGGGVGESGFGALQSREKAPEALHFLESVHPTLHTRAQQPKPRLTPN